MTRKNLFSVISAIMISLTFAGLVSAQEVTGSIVGTVKDSNGAAVSGATVTITDRSKGTVVRTVTSNDDGIFSVPNLNISIYDVSAEAPNFKKSVVDGVKVDLGQRRSVELELTAGRIDETVTVNADAVSVELSTPTAGTTVNGDQVRELSLNNRNWVQLVAIAPGVSNDLSDQVYTGTTNPEGQANTINISVNGARSSQNTFTVDGADVTDRGSNLTIQAYPSVDSIGEFKVLRSLYPAESGRSGGGQVNVITRSGSSKFHGSAYEFVRNEVFNANNFLANGLTTAPFGRDTNGKVKRAPFRYNNFGWTFSGPVYFLKFGEKDPDDDYFGKLGKTFFFFSQEFRKDRRFSAPVTTSVPDLNLRNGIFPIDVCINRTNVVTENCTVGNPGRLIAGTPLPASFYSPAARAYLNGVYNFMPLPNNPSISRYALSASIRNVSDFRQEILKIDHTFNDKLSGYYRYQQDKIPTIDGNSLFSSGGGIPGVSTTSTNSPGKTHTAQVTYVAKPNLIIEARYNYGYGAILSENIGTLALSRTQVPITLPFVNQRDRIPSITGNGFTGLTSFGPYDNFSYKSNWSGSVTYIAGDHTMKFGLVHSKYRKNENALAGSNEGAFNAFSATAPVAPTSPIPGDITAAIAANIQRWANFLVGNTTGFTQASFDYTADLRQMAFEGFAQDEWRIRRNLTLYMGARYSFFGSPWDRNGRLSNFVPSLYNPANAPQVTGAGIRVLNAPGVANGNWCNGIIVNSQNVQTGPAAFNCSPTISPYGKFVTKVGKNDIAPRVGLAWDPFGDGKTSVRTGYGIYHEQVLNGFFLQNIGTNAPYQVNATVTTPTQLDAPATGVSAAATVPGLRAVQSEWQTPYMQHWSLDLQRQIGNKTIFTVGYFGSKGTNLIGVTDINSIRPGKALASQCAQGANYYGSVVPPTLVACQTPGYIFRNVATQLGNPNGTTNDTLILDQLRPYKGYRAISMIETRYNSNYHSMQLSAQHRFTGASQVNLAYTWSKNLTDNQTDRSTAPQDTYNVRGEYARATLDRRHVFNVNYIYELPFFDKQKDLVGKILGGWQASGIVTLQTGLPFTVTTSNFDPAGTGIILGNPVARPNVTCDPNAGAPQTQQQYFNTSCFTTVTSSNTPGNSGRGIVQGPGTVRVDFTMVKNIRFGERMKLQLRGETFNLFNKTNFRGFTTLNNTAIGFGSIGSVRDPRTMQFAAKFSF